MVWFKSADEALADQRHFLAYVMTCGTPEDLAAVRAVVPAEAFGEVLNDPPASIFDARSWAYWNLVIAHLSPAPPLPQRMIAGPYRPGP